MRFRKKATTKATTNRKVVYSVEDGLGVLETFGVLVPTDPDPAWVRAALLRLARDLRAQASAVSRLARDMRDD